MRTYEDDSYKVSYPDLVCSAFNPQYVEVESLDDSFDVAYISINGDDYKMNLYNGSAKMYISRILQLCFADGEYYKEITVVVSGGGEQLTSFTLKVFWGLQKPEDVHFMGGLARIAENKANIIRRYTAFRGFPFSYNSFIYNGDETFILRANGQWMGQISPISGYYTATPTISATTLLQGFRIKWGNSRKTDLANLIGSMLVDSEWNTNYQTYNTIYETIYIDVVDKKEGCYLRWHDHHGNVCYYLFDKGDATESTEIYGNTNEVAFENNGQFYQGVVRNTGYTMKKNVKACAVHLDEYRIDYIKDIAISPYVDLYLGKNLAGNDVWMPVTILASEHSFDPNKILHSFEIDIQIPQLSSQTI